MKILYDNIDATLTPSSENSNFLFDTAFDDNRLSRSGRFTGITSENLLWNNSSGIPFSEILVANNNFSAAATVKFQAHIENIWTDPYINVTLTRLNNGYYYYNFDPVPSPATDNVYMDGSDDTYADEDGNNYSDYDKEYYIYCRILVTDPTNTETYLKVSKVFIGDSLTLPGIDPSCDLPIESNSIIDRNLTGQIFTDRRIQIKSGKFKFPVITETQRQELITMFETVDITDPFFLLIWESTLDVEPPLYAVLNSNLNIKKLQNLLYTVDFDFQEVK